MKIAPDAPVADKPAAPAADKPPLPAQPQTSDRPRAGSRLLAKLRALVIPIAVLLLAVGIVVLITTRWNSWVGGRSTQSTDDAYVRADVTPLSTKISGIFSVGVVEDYEHVKVFVCFVHVIDDNFDAQVDKVDSVI